MKDALLNAWKIPDLRKRLLFTGGMLAVYRLGAHIPVPGIDPAGLKSFWGAGPGGVFGLLDMFAGGAFQRFSLFALGIMPYINASIIIQLLTIVFPDSLGKLAKEGESGRQQLTKYTRYGTVALAAIQGAGLTWWIIQAGNNPAEGYMVVPNPGFRFWIVTILSLASGTALLMWIGEQITENGIGNGISLIIFAGILAGFPGAVVQTFALFRQEQLDFPSLLVIGGILLVVTAATVIITMGQRKVPIQYAKRIRGRRVYGGTAQYLPLRVNAAGVIPVIFAQALVSLPMTLAGFIGAAEAPGSILGMIFDWTRPGGGAYNFIYAVLIIFFTYFYTAVIINPDDIADNLKKSGGSIPGTRPGKPTADFIEKVVMRITLAGALFLAGICLFPGFLISHFGVPFYFGGTALLIVVGVDLDTVSQMESHLVMRHYDGFFKGPGGKVKGRRG